MKMFQKRNLGAYELEWCLSVKRQDVVVAVALVLLCSHVSRWLTLLQISYHSLLLHDCIM